MQYYTKKLSDFHLYVDSSRVAEPMETNSSEFRDPEVRIRVHDHTTRSDPIQQNSPIFTKVQDDLQILHVQYLIRGIANDVSVGHLDLDILNLTISLNQVYRAIH